MESLKSKDDVTVAKIYTHDEAVKQALEYFHGDNLAANVFVSKYAMRDVNGNILEATPDHMHSRLAKEYARIEKNYPNALSEHEIFELFRNFQWIIPQGSPMSAIGNDHQIQSCSNCFVAGTRVFTTNGIKNIEDIVVGDKVITHTGNIRNVLQVHKNALNGRQVVNLKCFRTPDIQVTENHKFYSISEEQMKWGESPQWNAVAYLREGDFVAIPNVKLSEKQNNFNCNSFDVYAGISEYLQSNNLHEKYEINKEEDNIDLSYVYTSGRNAVICRKKHRAIKSTWQVDEDFAYFLGLWFGDGCVFSSNSMHKNQGMISGARRNRKASNLTAPRGITFTFGSHESKIIEFVSVYGQKLLGIKPDINNFENVNGTCQIVFASAAVGMAFEQFFGRKFDGKKINQSIFAWDYSLVKALTQGFIDSDGTITKDGDIRVVMGNKSLVESLYFLLRQFGEVVGLVCGEKYSRIDFPKNSKFAFGSNKTYNDTRINDALNRGESKFHIIEIDGTKFVKIDSKTKTDLSPEFVYTLGVEEDHSYCVEGVMAQNCFVIPSPEDSYGGILKTDQEQAQIMKRRGGVGFDISNIRPKGLITKNAARTTDGIGVFMERFSNTCREVAQNGRRGALMLTISCHHPEIRTFINIKKDKTKVTGANISIRLSDEFMNAVKNKSKVELRWPVDSDSPKISENVDAVDLWKEIIQAAWESAEPGLLFWDTAQKYTPSDIYKEFGYESTATNPCLTYETKVAVADGRGMVEIGKLAEEGLDVPVYCCDDQGKIAVRTMRNPRITGYSEDVYKVTLDDGSSFKATGNHKVMLNSGEYVEVLKLKAGDSLHIGKKYESTIVESFAGQIKSRNEKLYYVLKNSLSNFRKTEHRYVYEYNFGEVPKNHVIHHIDHNSKNNTPENLESMHRDTHKKLHARNMEGENNPIFKIKADPERFKEYSRKMSESCSGNKNGNAIDITNDEIKKHGINLTLSLGQRFSHNDWANYAKEKDLPQTFADYRKQELGDVAEFAEKCALICGFSKDSIEADPRLIRTLKKAEKQGYSARISGSEVLVQRKCACCGEFYNVKYERREQSVCSTTCSNVYVNKNTDTNDRRAATINATYSKKANENKKKQLDAYTKLKFSLNRKPMLKEWENECKKNNISCRLKTKHGFKNFSEVEENAATHNHRVVSVEYDGKENVYNGTVDEFHNFYMGGWENTNSDGRKEWLFISTRNCGEIVLSPFDSCRLMCVNLLSFVENKFTANAKFNYKKLEEIAEIAQRLMDDMIDIELEQIDKILNKIENDPESDEVKLVEKELWQNIRQACVNGRRTGLGITALGDAVAALNVRYGSKESVEVTEMMYKSLAIGSYRSSCKLAKERGAFPIFNHDLERNHPYLQRIWDAAPDVYEMYKKHGRRNIANLTTAPTGSVSTLTQTTSGIEPAYLVFYKRRKKINPGDGQNVRVDFVDQNGDKWQEFPVFHHQFKSWMDVHGYEIKEDEIKTIASVDDLSFYKKSPYYKATSNDVDWSASVEVQGVAQKWVDHAISKTCNLPNDVTQEVVAEVYMKAWEAGCKGFTVYRDGCRTGVLVSNTPQKKDTLTKTTAPKRPKALECDVHHIKSRGEDFFVLVSMFEGHPYEVFAGKNGCITTLKKGTLTKNKRGHYELKAEDGSVVENVCDLLTDEQAVITRMISLALRHGSDIAFIVDQLEKSPGDMTNFGKAMARVLKKYIPDGTKATGATCDACGGVNVVRMEGCLTCKDCGGSKCS